MRDRYSSTCFAGFILSTLIPLPLAAIALLNFSTYSTFVMCACVIIATWFMGLIFSVIGVVSARKSGKKGKALGIAGVIISALGIISLVVFNVALLWMAVGLNF